MPTADSGCSWVEDMIGDSHPCKAIAKTRWVRINLMKEQKTFTIFRRYIYLLSL